MKSTGRQIYYVPLADDQTPHKLAYMCKHSSQLTSERTSLSSPAS